MHIDTKKKYILILFVLIFWLIPGRAWAILKAQKVNSGNTLYKKGKYDASIEKYRQALKNDPESDIINFNLGTTYYKQGMYDQAIEHLQKSVLTDNDTLRQQAYYNLGNGLYRVGEVFIQNNLVNAIDFFTMALGEYEKALQLDKEDKDAQFNYEFVKKRLEQLKQQFKQQQQYKKDGKEKNQDKENQSNQPSSDQQNDNQQNNQNQESQNQQDNQDQQNKQDNQNTQDDQNDQNNPPDDQNQNQQNDQQDKNHPDQEDQDSAKNPQKQKVDSQNQDKESAGTDSGQQSDTADQKINDGELTQKEAQMLLQDYQQRIEPEKFLKFDVRTKHLPVLKDW